MKFKINDKVSNVRFGVGFIKEINPYIDGTPFYQTNNHYKVIFDKGIRFTILEEDLNEI